MNDPRPRTRDPWVSLVAEYPSPDLERIRFSWKNPFDTNSIDVSVFPSLRKPVETGSHTRIREP